MQYLTTFLSFTFLSFAAAAQLQVAPLQVSRQVSEMPSAFTVSQPQDNNRVSIWSNDFSNCDDWLIETAYANGFLNFNSEVTWECGVGLAPSGQAPIAPINSTSAANGFMLVDSDANADGVNIENCWFQNVTPINCSGISNVSIQFENQYFKWDSGMNDNNEKCLLEVSRDGVTWPSVNTWQVADGFVDFGSGPVQARWECFPDLQTQDPVNNPTVLIFNISSAAQNAETLYLRFRWKGTWGYSWMVDDVSIFETGGYDIAIDNYVSLTDFESTGIYDYGVWPYSQLIPLEMAAEVRNNGVNTAENVVLNVAVNGESVQTTSDPVNIAPSEVGIAGASGYTPPAVEGTYNVQLTAAMDEDDENPDDNTVNRSFEVSEYLYARDNGVINGSFPAASYSYEFIVANGFQFSEPTTVYAIDVAFTAANAGAEAQVFVLDENFDIVANSTEVVVNPLLLNGDQNESNVFWTTVPLLEPFDVPANSWFCAGVNSYQGQGIRVGRSVPAPQQSSFAYGFFGTQGFFDWYFINNTAMVRFNLDPASSTPQEPVTSIEISAPETVILGAIDDLDDAELSLPATVTNTGSVPLTLRVSRELISTVDPYNEPYEPGFPGARDRFAWGEVMYDYGTAVSPDNQILMVTLQPGESTDSFEAIYEHMGVSGTTQIRYCFFDNNDPSVQACVDLYFTALEEVVDCEAPFDFGDEDFGISPNPFLGESFATGCLNEFYSDVLHLKMPNDASSLPILGVEIPPGIAIDSTEIVDLTLNGAPLSSIGLSFTCAGGEVNTPCTIPPMGQSCLQIYGIASLVGEFTVAIQANFFITVFGQVTVVSETFEIPLTIDSCLIPGCIDEQACNYAPEAELDDDSCIYPPEGNLSGVLITNAFDTHTYTYEGTPADEYIWAITNGTIISGMNSPMITVNWGDEGLGEVCLDLLVEGCEPVSYCNQVTVVSETAILGCTDPEACNFMPEATYYDGSCVFEPFTMVIGPSVVVVLEEVSYTAPIVIEGTFEWDVDGGIIIDEDGDAILVSWQEEGMGLICVTINTAVCDPIVECLEVFIEPTGIVFGCIDSDACNFNPEATEDDGSCDYVSLEEISGAIEPEVETAVVYSYPSQMGSTYEWTTTSGSVISGQGSSEVTIVWDTDGTESICVTETRFDECVGSEVCLEILVQPSSISEQSVVPVVVYPNPFDAQLNISIEMSEEVRVVINDNVGRLVLEEKLNGSKSIDVAHLASGLYHLTLFSRNDYLLHRSSVVKQ